MQACKPGSVSQLLGILIIYLRDLPADSGEYLLPEGIVDLFDLAARKVYHAPSVTLRAVGSYPTFSPSPRRNKAVYFLWHCLLPKRLHCGTPGFPGYGTLCCPDFPPPDKSGSDKTACIPAKLYSLRYESFKLFKTLDD